MSVLTDTFRQLAQRRFLPFSILLVAALAAVPLLLAKDPEPTAAPPAPKPAATVASAATGEPIVTLVADGERTERRRVLGARKNPFEPAPVKAVDPTSTTATTPSAPQTSTSEPKSTGGAPSASGPLVIVPNQPVPPVGTEPPAPKRTYELYSLTVRFGDSSAESLEKLNLVRLKPLPSAEDPILVYLGIRQNGKTAVFMVDANVVPRGDGTCRPSPVDCETIHLREGHTELFDVTDEAGTVTAQYQLDLLDVKRRTTASAAKAMAFRARASKAGRKVLRANGPLRYRYHAESGTVRKLDAKDFEALVAKTARFTGSFLGGF